MFVVIDTQAQVKGCEVGKGVQNTHLQVNAGLFQIQNGVAFFLFFFVVAIAIAIAIIVTFLFFVAVATG